VSEKDRRSRKEELDSFWDIERIVPQRTITPRRPTRNTETVEITVSSVLESMTDKNTFKSSELSMASTSHFASSGGVSSPELEYEPENSLIHKVRVYGRSSQYKYYEDFCIQAQKYKDERRDSADYTPFFSYVPQYDQLNDKQLEYYLYFRTKAREGIFVEADMSYVLLYAYELINLGDRVDTKASQKMLYSLWCEYGKKYPKLNKQLIEWLADYSLIHRLAPPENADVGKIAEVSSLKEFFLVQSGSDYTSYAKILLAFSSSYDYRKSKFYNGDAATLFDEHIPKVMGDCVKQLSSDGILSGLSSCDSTLPRDAYAGALCSYRAKKKIEIEFCSFSRTNELRYVVGEIVKYSENKIRAYVGVKSRLSCYLVDNSIKELVDNYFSRVLVKVHRPVRKEKREEYDVLYDLPKSAFSLSGAKRIEAESWETTKRLIEAFESEELVENTENTEEITQAEDTPVTSNGESELSVALGNMYNFAVAILNRDTDAQNKEAARLCRLPDSIIDSINEIAANIIGDVLIEDDGEGYAVVEDYREYLL